MKYRIKFREFCKISEESMNKDTFIYLEDESELFLDSNMRIDILNYNEFVFNFNRTPFLVKHLKSGNKFASPLRGEEYFLYKETHILHSIENIIKSFNEEDYYQFQKFVKEKLS